jgi:two-component system response regulator HydG
MTLLAIDDDETQLELLKVICAALSYPKIEFLSAVSVAQGLEAASRKVVDFILTDHHLPDGTGFDVLKSVKALNPMISVVVMTAFDDAREAVELLKAGAEDYLVKPTPPKAIERIVLRVNEKYALMHEALLPPIEGPAASPATAGIVYRSDTMARMLSIAARAAPSSATVLITGESGTGKELVARFIHDRSSRKGAFVAVNISALAESLAESELFGRRIRSRRPLRGGGGRYPLPGRDRRHQPSPPSEAPQGYPVRRHRAAGRERPAPPERADRRRDAP